MSTNYKNPNGRMIRILLLSIAALLCLSVFVLPATAADGSSAAVTDAQLMDLNVPFIANSGQQPADVKFYADTFYGRVFVTNVDLTHAVEASTDDGVRGVALKEQFVAANDTVISFIPAGEDPAETKVSYFIGNDASKWQTGLPAYNLISLGEIWPGITVKAQAHGATVEKIFTVAPGASPDTICVKVQGADSLRIARDGSLVIVTSDGEISLTAPWAYQDGKDVMVAYRVLDEGTYGFAVGEYDRTKVLVIDPSLAYSTYLGGSDRDHGYGIATGTDGSAYVGGYTYSTDFPTTTGAYQTTYGSGTSDAFVTKLNPDGSGLAYSTYLGGTSVDWVYGIAVDSSGNAYIAGSTTSSDFPTTEGAFSRTLSGSQDGIVVQINPSGTSILYSTYLGGATVVYSSQGQEEVDGITVDSAGKIYVTGRTGASDFPVTAGAYNTTIPYTNAGALFGFITVINPAGSGTGDLTYSTYLGGEIGTHYSRAITLDSSGMIYVAGQTTSDVFPVTTGAFQTTKQCAGDNYNGFMSKLNPVGSGTGDLVYSTYLAGTDGATYPRGIGVDGGGIVYVAGYTASTDFPTTTGAYQTTNAGGNDAFVCTINPAGSGTGDLVYSTYFGGTGIDYGYGSALDSSGTVYLTGSTYSSDFPTTIDASQMSLSGTRDAFVAKINPAGSGMGDLVYSTYFGGTGTDGGYAIALDSADNAYLTGLTASADFPVTSGASQATYGGGSYDAFVTKISFASAPVPPVPPVAAFTSDVQSGTTPLTVNFTDQSTNTPTSWAWDFTNDGTVDSTEQSPVFIYNTAGTYTVNLTVTNTGGSNSEVKMDYITVAPPTPALLWGPYLTGTTTTGTVVNVKTNIATAVTVEYATDAYYTVHSVYDQSATDSVTDTLHHVSLAGLTPDTLYHYRVVYDGQQTGDLHFRTFPASGAFTFVMYSDTQDQLPTYSQLERHKLIADRIAEEPDVAFVLNSGDLVNDAANLSDWDRYFAAGSMMMANTTVYPALGNHDNNDPNYFAAYGVPSYYSFDCGDGHVAVLDSNDWAWPALPTQSAWLATDLQTDKPFKFASFHHPLYTSEAKHFGGWENLREAWESEFNDNGVLAVFNGHIHAYERFLVNDTNYFVAGIGGGPAYNLATPRAPGSQNSLEYMIGYIRMTVDPAAKTATAQVIRVADVSSDLKTLTNIYPAGTVFETVVMSLTEPTGAPIAAFTADVQTGSAPLTVNFTDASTGSPTSWAWDFTNDGTIDSTEQSPSHTYTSAGTYTVNLTVTNAAGSDDEVKTDYITATEPAPLPVLNMDTGVRYATIQAAVNSATAGNTLVVSDGAFTENVDVNKQLVIRSENGATAVTVTAASPTLPVFDVNANGVVIRGFTVRGPTNEHVAGIEIVDFNDCLVIENDCAGCYNGIHIGGTGTNNTVSDNYCHGNTKRGISVRDTAHNNIITLNTAEANTDAGICIKDFAANNELWLNDIISNRVEILTENTAHSPNPITYTYNGCTYTSYLGNYYFDYSGADTDGNGVGTPAYSYGTYGDGYPLMAQYTNYVETTPVAPTAVFTANVTSGTAPLTVEFTDQSVGLIDSYAWDFENDGTVDSTAQNPSHIYDAAGTYTVNLTVTNAGVSDSEVKTDYITVNAAPVVPVAAFSSDIQTGTAPLTVQFNDQSTGTVDTYAWDFENDGTVDSTAQNPSHTYSTVGTYTVKLTVTNTAGSDSEVKTSYIVISSPTSGAALSIRPGDPSVILGQSRTVDVVLSEAAAGLAGYNITITLADGTKAEITGASFPGWAGVHQQGIVPADSIWVKGLDLNKQVEAGATDIVLATLTLRGDQLGTTTLRAEATVMDDDDGTAMDPAPAEVSLSVIQQVPQVPGYPAPTDPNGDGLYEDLNGNGRVDFNDVVVFFNNMEWISVQDGFGYFDFNRNGRIDFDDVVRLFWGV